MDEWRAQTWAWWTCWGLEIARALLILVKNHACSCRFGQSRHYAGSANARKALSAKRGRLYMREAHQLRICYRLTPLNTAAACLTMLPAYKNLMPAACRPQQGKNATLKLYCNLDLTAAMLHAQQNDGVAPVTPRAHCLELEGKFCPDSGFQAP